MPPGRMLLNTSTLFSVRGEYTSTISAAGTPATITLCSSGITAVVQKYGCTRGVPLVQYNTPTWCCITLAVGTYSIQQPQQSVDRAGDQEVKVWCWPAAREQTKRNLQRRPVRYGRNYKDRRAMISNDRSILTFSSGAVHT